VRPASARKLLDEYIMQFESTGVSDIYSGLPLPNGTTLATTEAFIAPEPGNGGSTGAVTGLGSTLTPGIGSDGIVVGADAGTTLNGGVDNEIRIVSDPSSPSAGPSVTCHLAKCIVNLSSVMWL
jgi:hypothetical protein